MKTFIVFRDQDGCTFAAETWVAALKAVDRKTRLVGAALVRASNAVAARLSLGNATSDASRIAEVWISDDESTGDLLDAASRYLAPSDGQALAVRS